jgi:pimeloyl-ACP methyl ester carboxylesterase
MACYVIAHGAWGGGWSWALVRPLLRAAGHQVFTPTYTGLGERAHLASPAVDLSTHVQDIVNVLVYEDLSEVILVGHSYGGMVITAVAGRIAKRLAHLVYLDAFVPAPGQSLFDLVDPAEAARFEASACAEGDGWRVPPAFPPSPAMPPPDRRRPHPLASFREPVATDPAVLAALPKTYVYCNDPPHGAFDRFASHARTDAGWRYRELPTGHNPQYTMPHELTALLAELA